LFVRPGETRPIVLSGDLYNVAVSRERHVPPFDSDADQTTASMRRVESLLEEAEVTVWIEYELPHFDRQKLLYCISFCSA